MDHESEGTLEVRSVREETVSLADTATLTCTKGSPPLTHEPVIDCVMLTTHDEDPEVEEVDDEEVEVAVDAE